MNPNFGSNSGMRFWGRIVGSNFLVLCFPIDRAPSKIHPQEIHRPKFTSKNSPRIRAEKFTLHFCRAILLTNGAFGPPQWAVSPSALMGRFPSWKSLENIPLRIGAWRCSWRFARLCLRRMLFLGRHACRTKLPPIICEFDTKSSLNNTKKDPKNDPNRETRILSPSQAA